MFEEMAKDTYIKRRAHNKNSQNAAKLNRETAGSYYKKEDREFLI